MRYHHTWQRSFPAVTTEFPWRFLNNRNGTQIPECIIQAITHALHTGIVALNNNESAALRAKLAAFLHVRTPETFYFSDSEAGIIHWLVYCWCFSQLHNGDEVILSSQDTPMIKATFDYVQQQMRRLGRSFVVREFGYQDNGEFDRQGLLALISTKTRLIFVPHIHPVFGTKNEEDIAFLKHHVGDQALVVVDLSQSVGRIPVHLERLGCDCAFFSGRHLFSPFPCGIGYIQHVLYNDQDPFLQPELANPVIIESIIQGIGELERVGMQQVALHLQALSHRLLTRLQQLHTLEFLPGIGKCEEWCSPGYGILSFQLPGVSADECSMLLAENALLIDRANIASYPDAVTVSLHLYNTFEHIDALVDCLQALCE